MHHDEIGQEISIADDIAPAQEIGEITAWARLLIGNSSVTPCRTAMTMA
jgi:hypothetical protein